MNEETITFKVGEKVYDIPADKKDAFVSKYKDAIELKSFVVGKDTFDIPLNKVDKFLEKYPNAKPTFGLGKSAPSVQRPAVDGGIGFGATLAGQYPSPMRANIPRQSTQRSVDTGSQLPSLSIPGEENLPKVLSPEAQFAEAAFSQMVPEAQPEEPMFNPAQTEQQAIMQQELEEPLQVDEGFQMRFAPEAEIEYSPEKNLKESMERTREAREKAAKAQQGSAGGLLWNSIVTGYGNLLESTAKSIARAATMFDPATGFAMQDNPEFEQLQAQYLNKQFKDLGIKEGIEKTLQSEGTTKEYIDRFKNDYGIVGEGIVGLAESLPAMATPAMAGMFFLGFNGAYDDIEANMPEISKEAKFLYSGTVGAVTMALGKFGFSQLVKNNSVTRTLAKRVLDQIPEGAKISPKIVNSTAAKVVNAFAAEAETGGTQFVAEEGIKQFADFLEGEKDRFKFDGWEKFTADALRAAGAEGVGGVALKSVGLAINSIRPGKKKDEAIKTFDEINQLQQQAASTENEEVKAVVNEEIKRKSEEILEQSFEDNQRYESLTPEQKTQVDELTKKIASLEQSALDINTSPEVARLVVAELNRLQEQVDAIYNSGNVNEAISFFQEMAAEAEPSVPKKIKSVAEIVAETKAKKEVQDRLEAARQTFKEQREKGAKLLQEKEEAAQKFLEQQRAQRDSEVLQIEAIRPDLTDQDLLIMDLPISVDKTLDRMDANIPTDVVQIDEAISALDKKFEELEAYKTDPKRTHTSEQIDEIIDLLSEAKSELQAYKEKLSDYESATKTTEPTETTEQRSVVEGKPKASVSEVASKAKTEAAELSKEAPVITADDFATFEARGKDGRKARATLRERIGVEAYQRIEAFNKNFEKTIDSLEAQGKIKQRCK